MREVRGSESEAEDEVRGDGGDGDGDGCREGLWLFLSKDGGETEDEGEEWRCLWWDRQCRCGRLCMCGDLDLDLDLDLDMDLERE